MDREAFKAPSGELRQITVREGKGETKDWAFIPNKLPPDWQLPDSLKDLLGDAREALGTLNGIGQTLTSPELLLTPLQSREALRSSSMEGTYATPVEMLRYELDPTDPTSDGDARNVWREVNNHNSALRHGFHRMKVDDFPMSLRLIREMHERLLGGVRGTDKQPGVFRTRQVHIGAGRRYIAPPPELLDECLQNFELSLHNFGKDDALHPRDGSPPPKADPLHPLVQAYVTHYQFEAIHPFSDGNGRIGRVLLSLMTCASLGHRHPWLYMSAFFDRHKDEYVDRLFRVSTHGDWDGWIEFCLRGTVYQCDDAVARCGALNILKTEWYSQHSNVSHRAHQIIGSLFDHPVFRVTDIMKLCKITRPTAQTDIGLLVKCGIVELIDGLRPRTYVANAILNIIDADDILTTGQEFDTPRDSQGALDLV